MEIISQEVLRVLPGRIENPEAKLEQVVDMAAIFVRFKDLSMWGIADENIFMRAKKFRERGAKGAV